MVLLALFAILGFLGYFEYIRIKRFHGGLRELAAFAAMMVLAVAYAAAVTFQWPLPNPTHVIQQTLGGIGEWIIPRS